MARTIRIGNLGYSMDNRDLARLFAPHGDVNSATVATRSNQSTGVGFVQMECDHEGEAAIAALNGRPHCGRMLAVRWSNPWSEQDAPRADLHEPVK